MKKRRRKSIENNCETFNQLVVDPFMTQTTAGSTIFFSRFRNSGNRRFLSTPQRNYLACLDVVLSHVVFLDKRSLTLNAGVRRATGARLFPTLDCSLYFQCPALTTAGSKSFHFHVQKSREIQGSLRRLSEMPLLPFFLVLAHAILMESKETASIRKMKISTSRQDI